MLISLLETVGEFLVGTVEVTGHFLLDLLCHRGIQEQRDGSLPAAREPEETR